MKKSLSSFLNNNFYIIELFDTTGKDRVEPEHKYPNRLTSTLHTNPK